jgi:hypothetical protein
MTIKSAETGAPAPELKALVTEATNALARLDVARLEELALCCRALTQLPIARTREEREALVRQADAMRVDMAVFARVLDATSANLKVMERLRALRTGQQGYSEPRGNCRIWDRKDEEGGDGND